jgi:uncharacterized protein YhaN
VIYGLGAGKESRYLPPVRGGEAGGWLDVAEGGVRYRLARHSVGTNGHAREVLSLATVAGAAQDTSLVPRLLHGVDEATFNNVFAVGLSEMQELGTLTDTAAARLLYDLTTGLDRVSLGDVMRELAGARRRLVAPAGEASPLRQLAARRAKLAEEVSALDGLTSEYAALAVERDELERELARLADEKADLERQARLVEVATLVRPRWAEREQVDRQLAACGEPRSVPERALERLEAFNARIELVQRRLAGAVRARKALRAEGAGLQINEALWRHAPRVAALTDQMEWIGALEKQAGDCDREVADLEGHLAAEQKRLGIDPKAAGARKPLTNRTLAALRPIARELRAARQGCEETRQKIRASRQEAAHLAEEAASALADLPEQDLMTAVEKAGELVTQLRRRQQIEQRLEQMVRQDAELEERSHELIDRQLLPLWVLAALGGLFVFGVVLILAAWFLPPSVTGSWGWALAVLGLGGTVAAAVMKHNLEKSAERQLESCEKQLAMLRLSIQQTKQERAELDAQLPAGGGPIVSRLEAAEKQLAELETLLPLEARRKVARRDGRSAAVRAKESRRSLIEARRRWAAALKAAGCPADLTPKQVRLVAKGSQRVRELERQLDRRRQERKQVERSWLGIHDRISRLAADVGLDPKNSGAVEQLRRMRQALGEQEALASQRDGLLDRMRKLRRRYGRLRRQHRAGLRRRRALLREAGVSDEADLRRLAEATARHSALRERRMALDREIAGAIAGQCAEEEMRALLVNCPDGALERDWDELAGRLSECDRALRQGHERKGGLAPRLEMLATDRRPAQKQLELAMVDEQLQAGQRRWQVLAATGQLVETVRRMYERERQPETLREASGYLARLTGGQYTRIWTPLSEDALFVDNVQGQSLPVEVLSRGTREQLFLSLRMALIGAYARHGARLPFVLDDVFVNFDTRRTKAAVELVIDFAAAGHQVVVFTCHDHILQMFHEHRAHIVLLPGVEHQIEEIVREPAERKPRLAAPAPAPVVSPAPILAPLPAITIAASARRRPESWPAPSEDEANFEGPVEDGFGRRWPESIEPELPPLPSEDEASFEGPLEDGFGLAWIAEAPPPPLVSPTPALPSPPAIEVRPKRPIRMTRMVRQWMFLGDGAEEFEGEFNERPHPSYWRDRFGYRHHDDEFGEPQFAAGDPDVPALYAPPHDDAEAA